MTLRHTLIFFLSFLITALGQSALLWWLAPVAACCGFALFWSVLLDTPSPRRRFLIGATWFSLVQAIQLSWGLSHPFLYIYAVYLFACIFYGIQFGLLNLLITRERFKSALFPFALAALWTLLEWSRLFILSGSSWNPTGMALTGNSYSLQMSSLFGIFGLSFWVIAVNGLCLRLWLGYGSRLSYGVATAMIAFPYLFGAAHIAYHQHQKSQLPQETLTTLLVQPNFPVEEWLPHFTPQEAFRLALSEWGEILKLVKPFHGEQIDLIVLPENVVPFAAYYPIYTYENVKLLFNDVLGPESLSLLPDLDAGWAVPVPTAQGDVWLVTNAYVAQAMTNWLQTSAIVGLEEREASQDGTVRSSASAFYFTVGNSEQERYDKRVLVPLGEYIPFAVLNPILAEYGIHSSFTPGLAAKIISCRKIPIGLSICYEETYGNLMRENRNVGAQLLVNLTNDGWYPDSHLPYQHFEHSRPRSVELGIPLVRACNTGYTCAVDSLGQVVAALDNTTKPGVLKAEIPLYHYSTLYARFGDALVIGTCLLIAVAFIRRFE